MKKIQLNIDDSLYNTVLSMLHGLPKQQIEIIELSPQDTAAKEQPVDGVDHANNSQFDEHIDWPKDSFAS